MRRFLPLLLAASLLGVAIYVAARWIFGQPTTEALIFAGSIAVAALIVETLRPRIERAFGAKNRESERSAEASPEGPGPL